MLKNVIGLFLQSFAVTFALNVFYNRWLLVGIKLEFKSISKLSLTIRIKSYL